MNNLRGIALMIAAMAGFAMEDGFIKAAAATLPTGQILIVLGIGGAAIFAAIARLRRIPLLVPAAMSRPVVIRNLSEMLGTMAFVSAITLSPLATVSAILQATPLAVTLGAALFLGAPVGWRRWSAIIVGFVGVLIIVRPGAAAIDLGSVLAVIGVLCLAARDLATRTVPATVPSLMLAAYGFASVIPAGIVLLAFSGGAVMPTQGIALALAAALIVGVCGYYAIVAAMRVGDIAVVTPFRYTRLIFALIIGIVFFAERPDLPTLAGAALIIASGLYTLVREARLARQGQSPLSSATLPG